MKTKSFSSMGHLRGEKGSVVALSGSSLTSELEMSLFRRDKEDLRLLIHRNGSSSLISHSLLSTYFDYVVSNSTNEVSQSYGFLKTSKISSTPSPITSVLKVIVGVTASIIQYYGSIELFYEWLSRVVPHVQALYYHPSLSFHITLDTPLKLIDLSDKTNISRASTNSLYSVVHLTLPNLKAYDGDHLAVFVSDDSRDQTYGISFLNGICSLTSIAVSINEAKENDVLLSAKILAHEVAHNMGVPHDKDPCKGIMYWAVHGGNTWSECSNQHFWAYYELMVGSKGYWCLDEDKEGSWEEWGPYSNCSKKCGGGIKTRTRVCSKVLCSEGLNSESIVCKAKKACRPCEDISSNCEEKSCTENERFMKKNCAKTCHVDKGPNCEMYKEMGYCEKSSSYYRNMLFYCAATCNIFCDE